jgi:hypothetical protein
MKTITRILLGLICVAIIFVILVNPVLKAFADEGDDAWGEFLNPDGSINWANLTYLGESRCRWVRQDTVATSPPVAMCWYCLHRQRCS